MRTALDAGAAPADVRLAFPSTRPGFTHAFGQLRTALDTYAVERQTRYRCELVFEEVVTNIMRHAYEREGAHEIAVAMVITSTAVIMIFEDDGRPFDPTVVHPPAPDRDIQTAGDGGRGLVLVRRAARELRYERTAEALNRFTVAVDGSAEG
jgi:anti-sigma regulatory factor (Ser/Thr protein kinase)